MWTLLLSNWKLVAGGTVAFLLLAYSHHLGASSVQEKWDASIVQATLAAAEKEHTNQLISNGVSHVYQTNISSVDSLYNIAINGLRTEASGDLPSISNPTTGHNAATCNSGLPNTNKIKLLELAKAAQIQTIRLVSCQKWIEEQGK